MTIDCEKFYDPSAIDFDERIASLRRPLIFTNGLFDILHATHVEYLKNTKDLGGTVIVAVNTDASSAAQNKSVVARPIQCLSDRVMILSALSSVDVVTCFDESNPLNLIKRVRPDILAKGTDYTYDQIVGKKEVEAWGGQVVLVDTIRIISTTEIIERIRRLPPR